MRADVSPEHVLRDLERLPLDDDVLDAAHERGARQPPGQPVRLLVAADEQAVVRVRGRDAGDTDAGLGKGAVHGESHHVLSLHRCKIYYKEV